LKVASAKDSLTRIPSAGQQPNKIAGEDPGLRSSTRIRASAVAALAVSFGLAASPALAQRTLNIATIVPPSALDPHYHNTSNNNQALRQIFDSLVHFDNEGKLHPGLAESWRAIDELNWEIKLRPGVRFHDGTPFEADDVAFSIARAPNVPNSPAAFTPYVRGIAAVEVVDPVTLRIRTKAPNPMMDWDLVFVLMLSRKIHGPEPSTADFNSGRLAIGTGPYRHVSFAPNERHEIARNPEYWGETQPWDRVVTRYIPNGGARVATLLSGEVDLVDGVPYQDMPRLSTDPNIAVFGSDSITSVYMFPDSMREQTPHVTDRSGQPLPRNPLADPRVRQAMSLAINRPAIVERLYQGQGRAADQFASPPALHRVPGLPPLPYDLARGRQLLAEAGYPDGFRMTIHGPNGFFSGDDNLLQAVAQGFTRIGIETQVQTLPPAPLFTRATNREFSLFMSYLSSDTAINYMRQVVMTRDPARGTGPFNRQHYSNPAVNGPAAEALRTMDEPRRAALTIEANRALLEDMGVIPLIYLRYNWAARKDRVRYLPSHRGYTSAMWAVPVQ
jgi:peptide/nickel transport system substrate-binding protein